jgi:hypothetical protein
MATTKQVNEEEVEKIFCEFCPERIKETDEYCRFCGKKQ